MLTRGASGILEYWRWTFTGDQNAERRRVERLRILGKRAAPAAVGAGGDAMNLLDLLQWPAMAMTIVAAWLVASRAHHRREIGFWCFLLSNVLWVAWGLHDRAYALVTLQVVLAALNIRGADKNAGTATEP